MAMNVVNRMISVAVSDDIVRRGGGDIYNMLFFLWTVRVAIHVDIVIFKFLCVFLFIATIKSGHRGGRMSLSLDFWP